MTPTYTDRVREHEAPHIRSPELQALDALLRIEELLTMIADNTRPSGTTALKPSATPKRTPRNL